VASILEQLQQGVGAQQAAAAARQAAKLAKKQGGDVAALTEQLQAVQVGSSSSSAGNGGVTGRPLQKALLVDVAASSSGGSTSSKSSSGARGSATASSAAGGVPPVTPGDITVAANALLVACKAAGALCGVPQLLQQFYAALYTHGWASPEHAQRLSNLKDSCSKLSAAVQEVAEWAVLLHPLLVQLLPAEQGQVLVDVAGSSSSSSSSSRVSGDNKRLSAEEVAAVLGALQHVVIPGQPGCSNPRCCCLEGVSEANVKTQVCGGCRGVRYCSAGCQKAHWRAGHKEVCKAAQAAAKAAAGGST
jgi:hypothetical protein